MYLPDSSNFSCLSFSACVLYLVSMDLCVSKKAFLWLLSVKYFVYIPAKFTHTYNKTLAIILRSLQSSVSLHWKELGKMFYISSLSTSCGKMLFFRYIVSNLYAGRENWFIQSVQTWKRKLWRCEWKKNIADKNQAL